MGENDSIVVCRPSENVRVGRAGEIRILYTNDIDFRLA
jgi:hypothetical protein